MIRVAAVAGLPPRFAHSRPGEKSAVRAVGCSRSCAAAGAGIVLALLGGMAIREKRTQRIRADLERRGVSADFSRRVSEGLEPFTEELAPEVYEAVLSGVTMAYGVHRRRESPPLEGGSPPLGRREGMEGAAPSRVELDEMQRLMRDFGNELRKLDEALELLAAYLTRMRAQRPAGARTLH